MSRESCARCPWRGAACGAPSSCSASTIAPGWRQLHRAAHSAVVLGAVALLGRRRPRARALALGWAGHLVVDYLTHATDAWPPLWPLSARGYPSPVSYWERERHAALWSRVETAALALATARECATRG